MNWPNPYAMVWLWHKVSLFAVLFITSFNSVFLFLRRVAKWLSQHNYLQVSVEKSWINAFPKGIYVKGNVKISYRIWLWFTNAIEYDDNRYTKCVNIPEIYIYKKVKLNLINWLCLR